MNDTSGDHRLLDHPLVSSVSTPQISHSPSTDVRNTPELDDVAYRQLHVGRWVLFQEGHRLRTLLGADLGKVTFSQPHSPLTGLTQSSEQVDQGRLARPVEANDHRHDTTSDRDVHPRKDSHTINMPSQILSPHCRLHDRDA